jgi:hypothetical protein
MNNNNNNNIMNKQDPLTELLSLPISFTVDPLNFNDMMTIQKKQEPATSFVSKKKSKITLEDKDQKTKER